MNPDKLNFQRTNECIANCRIDFVCEDCQTKLLNCPLCRSPEVNRDTLVERLLKILFSIKVTFDFLMFFYVVVLNCAILFNGFDADLLSTIYITLYILVAYISRENGAFFIPRLFNGKGRLCQLGFYIFSYCLLGRNNFPLQVQLPYYLTIVNASIIFCQI